jgi:hypothetical protein
MLSGGTPMITNPIEIVGTWEQIADQAPHYAQFKMRLTVLPELASFTPVIQDTRTLEDKIAEIVARVLEKEWDNLPAEKLEPLDDWERLLFGIGTDCGVSLPDAALSSEGLYE